MQTSLRNNFTHYYDNNNPTATSIDLHQGHHQIHQPHQELHLVEQPPEAFNHQNYYHLQAQETPTEVYQRFSGLDNNNNNNNHADKQQVDLQVTQTISYTQDVAHNQTDHLASSVHYYEQAEQQHVKYLAQSDCHWPAFQTAPSSGANFYLNPTGEFGHPEPFLQQQQQQQPQQHHQQQQQVYDKNTNHHEELNQVAYHQQIGPTEAQPGEEGCHFQLTSNQHHMQQQQVSTYHVLETADAAYDPRQDNLNCSSQPVDFPLQDSHFQAQENDFSQYNSTVQLIQHQSHPVRNSSKSLPIFEDGSQQEKCESSSGQLQADESSSSSCSSSSSSSSSSSISEAPSELDSLASQMTRDEKKALEANIPLSYHEIVNLTIDQFNEQITRYNFSENQLSLMKDIRRRGKNKVAAQTCRKRKMEQISVLAREVGHLKLKRRSLSQERAELIGQHQRLLEEYDKIYSTIKERMQDHQQHQVSPVQQ